MRIIKRADRRTYEEDNRPTMHGTKAEWRLMQGKGGLIKWSGDRVQVTGEKPDSGRP